MGSDTDALGVRLDVEESTAQAVKFTLTTTFVLDSSDFTSRCQAAPHLE